MNTLSQKADMAATALAVRLVQTAGVPLDLEFKVGFDETLGLVGPSGSGKTTTLRAIAGLMMPDEGRVALGSKAWLDTKRGVALRPEERRVGFVFQDYALFPHLDAKGNVALAMRDLPAGERSTEAVSLLRRVGLDGKASSYPDELSGGERQRVALARALARRPEVLLLDEPFSAVDRPTRELLKREIRAVLSDLSVPVVLVTHDIADVESLCTHLLVMDKGHALAFGATRDVLSVPRNDGVARVLGLTEN